MNATPRTYIREMDDLGEQTPYREKSLDGRAIRVYEDDTVLITSRGNVLVWIQLPRTDSDAIQSTFGADARARLDGTRCDCAECRAAS